MPDTSRIYQDRISSIVDREKARVLNIIGDDRRQDIRRDNLVFADGGSEIDQVNENIVMIADWMKNQNLNGEDTQIVYLKPRYRGSRDSFTLESFFGRVYDVKNTIFFCKVKDSDHCFGAYNKVGYKAMVKIEGQRSPFVDFSDDSAFLFSVTNRTKHIPYGNKKDIAVRHTSKDFMIVLG